MASPSEAAALLPTEEEIDRVDIPDPHLNDDDSVAAHRDDWLK